MGEGAPHEGPPFTHIPSLSFTLPAPSSSSGYKVAIMRTTHWLTTGEVAARSRTTPQSVLKWIRRGALPARRLPGGAYRVSEADLDRFLRPVPVLCAACGGEVLDGVRVRVDGRPVHGPGERCPGQGAAR
jgi:excisionase family DNA binding protein